VNHLNVNGSPFIENHQEPNLWLYLVAKIGKRAIFAILQLSFTGFVAFLFRGIIIGFARLDDAMR